jgi:hypothetical protein
LETAGGIDPIACFNEMFRGYLGGEEISEKIGTSKAEGKLIEVISNRLDEMLGGGNGRRRVVYYLGLVIDFCLLTEKCLRHIGEIEEDHSRDETIFFESFPLITKRGETQANTLSVQLGSRRNDTCGIRKIEEMVVSYFENIERVGYPSAYVYNTGQWHKYQDTLGGITRLSSSGRRALLYRVINRSLLEFRTDPTSIAVDPTDFADFDEIVRDYPRSYPQWENGGLAFQAMCYAYLSELYKDLSVVASSVRTGSSRQKRIGDIDIYDGYSLRISCEVKDFHIDAAKFDDEIASWDQKATRLGAQKIVACESVNPETAKEHQEVEWLTLEALEGNIRKECRTSRARMTSRFLHYLIVIERNPKGLERALEFISSRQQVTGLSE